MTLDRACQDARGDAGIACVARRHENVGRLAQVEADDALRGHGCADTRQIADSWGVRLHPEPQQSFTECAVGCTSDRSRERYTAGRVASVVRRRPRDVGDDAVAAGQTVRERAVGDDSSHRVRDDVHTRVLTPERPDLVPERNRTAIDRSVGVVWEAQVFAEADDRDAGHGRELAAQPIERAVVGARARLVAADEHH